MRRLLLLATVLLLAAPAPVRAAGDWTWPVEGPVLRGFDPPDTPFGAGHRGIDIAAPIGTPVHAAAVGVVTFAGPVGGRLFVTIDHGGGLESRYSFLDALLVRRHETVSTGQPIARSGPGHAGDVVPSLHFAALRDDAYFDPLTLLGPIEVWRFIRLAPLAAAGLGDPLL
ncbi:MAG TPA: M23 family metallopeptidase [Actinomycetota bacterium]|nr:M23 family metallopeptidase [Actinomycetota bacterium]